MPIPQLTLKTSGSEELPKPPAPTAPSPALPSPSSLQSIEPYPPAPKPSFPPSLPPRPSVPPNLPPSSPPLLSAGKKRSGRGVKIAFIVIALLLAAAIPFGASAFRTWRAVSDASDASSRALLALEKFDIAAARDALGDAGADLHRAETSFRLWRPLTRLPFVGDDIASLDNTVRSARDLVLATEHTLAAAEEVLLRLGRAESFGTPEGLVAPERDLGSLSPDERRSVLAKLASFGTLIEEIERSLQNLAAALAAIPRTGVAKSFGGSIAPFEERVRNLQGSLRVFSPLVTLLPELLGYPNEKNYLFFFANNTEIRPSGGFFGFYGTVNIRDGEIVSLVSDDVYNLDFPAAEKVTRLPPEPFRTYMGVNKWFLRDANWSPDFQESARQALELYREEHALQGLTPAPVDGVIAVTPDLAIDLLRIVGPVTVSGVTFTPENLVQELEYQVEFAFLETGIPISARKQILGDLTSEVVHRLNALPSRRWREVVGAIEEAARTKQILFYEEDPRVQALFERYKVAGRVEASEGDGLLIVDANLGALKTDAVMERSVHYAVWPDADGKMVAEVNVKYRNNGNFTPYTTRYRTYTRFYVPKGSTLISAEGHLRGDALTNPKREPGKVDVTEELNRTVFGMFTSVEPRETRTLRVRYELPAHVAEMIRSGRYALRFDKQSGAQGYPLTVDLLFGKRVAGATPSEPEKEWGDDRYKFVTDLSEDRVFEVGF